MAETFLILLAGGIMLAAAVSDPWQVTLNWLRLAGILALAMAGISVFFLVRRGGVNARDVISNGAVIVAVLGQLGFVQVAWRKTQQVSAFVGFFIAVSIGAAYLRSASAA